MITTVTQVIVFAACVLIMTRTEPAMARMGRRTAFPIRMAMHLLTVGAAWQIGAILLFGDVPSYTTVILVTGAASLLLCERRLRMLTGRMGRRAQDRGVI